MSYVMPTQCAFTGYVNDSQEALDRLSFWTVMIWKMVPSCCFFPYLELHYYDHWSYRIIYLINCFKSPNYYSFYLRLRHASGNVRNNNLVKDKIQVIELVKLIRSWLSIWTENFHYVWLPLSNLTSLCCISFSL